MLENMNFAVGEAFPLPIAQKGDGAMFQIDRNGAMFILQLSAADVIAVEAFRTGRMEFALFEADGGAWKLAARHNIAAYFEDKLKDLVESGKVVVAQ